MFENKHTVSTLTFFGLLISIPGICQQPTASNASTTGKEVDGKIHKDRLPDDLPQAKLLFIKFSRAEVPTEKPKDMPRSVYKHRQYHNSVINTSNRQLKEAAVKYPYSYRITTLDSVEFYKDHGYKYLFFNSSFNSFIDGSYQGSSLSSNGVMTTTTVTLYIRDLTNNDKYTIDDFSEKFIYYNRGQVGMLLKKISKQLKNDK